MTRRGVQQTLNYRKSCIRKHRLLCSLFPATFWRWDHKQINLLVLTLGLLGVDKFVDVEIKASRKGPGATLPFLSDFLFLALPYWFLEITQSPFRLLQTTAKKSVPVSCCPIVDSKKQCYWPNIVRLSISRSGPRSLNTLSEPKSVLWKPRVFQVKKNKYS